MLDERRQDRPADAALRRSEENGRDGLGFRPDPAKVGGDGGKPDGKGRRSDAPDRDEDGSERGPNVPRRHSLVVRSGALILKNVRLGGARAMP